MSRGKTNFFLVDKEFMWEFSGINAAFVKVIIYLTREKIILLFQRRLSKLLPY